MQYINSWDLVDTSADKLLGAYLRDMVKDEVKITKKLQKLPISVKLNDNKLTNIIECVVQTANSLTR